MPVPVFAQVLLAVLLIGSAALAIKFWNKILSWADQALFPWIRKYLPDLEFPVRNAFAALDKVVTPLNKLTDIKKAWEILREHLLKVLVQFDLNARDEWVKRITYWVIRSLKSKQAAPVLKEEIVDFDSSKIHTPESNKSEVVRVVAEEIVAVDSLPSDVRQEWLKHDKKSQNIDVTQLRDRELELAMTNSN